MAPPAVRQPWIVSLGLRINRSDKRWTSPRGNRAILLKVEKFGTNLAGFANMLSLIHRNLY
jgi:hypothetical protein